MASGAKSFFATLFDFEFKHFVTIQSTKVIYMVLMGVLFLVGALFFFSLVVTGLANDSLLTVVGGFVVVPLVTLAYLVFLRIFMETIVVFFRIGENTTAMVSADTQTPGGTVVERPTPPPYEG